MKKINVIYWSGTGNTEAMAEAVAEGARLEGAEVSLIRVSEATKDSVLGADALAMGCPSMGAEVLEESEMEPFIASIETLVAGKPLALFGSYGWGSGDWMQDWVTRMKGCGAKVIGDGLIFQDHPDAQGLAACRALGSNLVKAE
jgi:flavodoxin short chain